MPSKPLSGRTVVVTRPKAQAREFARGLTSAGARVILAPAIRIAPPSSYAALDRALRGLNAYDLLVFTSRNAVERFFERAKALRLGHPRRPRRLYAIGPQTASALRARGWRGPEVPEEHRGEALAAAIGEVRGKRVLIPRAKTAREELPRLLRRRGARVSIVEAYRTLPDKSSARRLREEASRGKIDAVAFASASSVREVFSHLGAQAFRRLFARAAAASIGPITSAALRSRGIRPRVEAPKATTGSLLSALKRYFDGARSRPEAERPWRHLERRRRPGARP